MFEEYIVQSVIKHKELIESASNPNTLVSSLLGIIWLAQLKFDIAPYLRRYKEVISTCLTQTMARVGVLLKDGATLLSLEPSDHVESRKQAK